ncbi:hypothetical protein WAX78_23210 [Bacillus sp. FJAT-53711]|uniref:Uncharacterized protein n=1 Tax=Bacillus yunxiaonensis TaxID=3127665 RepID=A0ABU8G210_9BACI
MHNQQPSTSNYESSCHAGSSSEDLAYREYGMCLAQRLNGGI